MTPAYVEYPFATPALAGLVRPAWGQAYGDTSDPLPGLIAPDAHVEIVFQVGAPCRIVTPEGEADSPAAMLYALRHGAQRLQPTGANRMVALRLTPAVASVVLRTSLADCWDRPVALSDLIGAEADDLLDALAAIPLERAGALLETWLLARLSRWASDDARQARLQSTLLWETAGGPVRALADDLGFSDRTLRRHCEAYAGLSPKQLVMSGRMLRACDLLRRADGLPLVEVADRLGFSDQAAFTNAFRHYLGMTPTALRAEPLVFYETRR